jgi:hypothetical protein
MNNRAASVVREKYKLSIIAASVIAMLAIAPASFAQKQTKEETTISTTTYNVHLAIRLNDKVIASPQITMLAGKAQIIANNPTTINPYKIQIILLDREKVQKKFPELDLKNSVARTVFIEVGVFLPASIGQPVNQWKRIATPAGLIQTDGQLLQIITDISKSPVMTTTSSQPVTKLSLDITALPAQL